MFRLVAVPPSLFSRPVYQTCTVAARKSPTPRSNVMHRRRHVGHQNGPFSALHAPSISVGNPAAHDMHIFDVNNCTYVYGQLPSPTFWRATKPNSNVGNVGEFEVVQASAAAATYGTVCGPSGSTATRLSGP